VIAIFFTISLKRKFVCICELKQWNNSWFYLIFLKGYINVLGCDEQCISDRRNQMSWTLQSLPLWGTHHFLEHQPWCSSLCRFVFFLCVVWSGSENMERLLTFLFMWEVWRLLKCFLVYNLCFRAKCVSETDLFWSIFYLHH